MERTETYLFLYGCTFHVDLCTQQAYNIKLDNTKEGNNRHPGNKKEDKFVFKKRLTQMNKRTQTSMPWVGFERTIRVLERAKMAHALVCAAIMIGVIEKYRFGYESKRKWNVFTWNKNRDVKKLQFSSVFTRVTAVNRTSAEALLSERVKWNNVIKV
jgi:hypothetical protein